MVSKLKRRFANPVCETEGAASDDAAAEAGKGDAQPAADGGGGGTSSSSQAGNQGRSEQAEADDNSAEAAAATEAAAAAEMGDEIGGLDEDEARGDQADFDFDGPADGEEGQDKDEEGGEEEVEGAGTYGPVTVRFLIYIRVHCAWRVVGTRCPKTSSFSQVLSGRGGLEM